MVPQSSTQWHSALPTFCIMTLHHGIQHYRHSALCILTLSIMTFSIMTIAIMAHNVLIFRIKIRNVTLSIIISSTMTFSITIRKCYTKHNGIQHNDTWGICWVLLCWVSFMVSVTNESTMLSVVIPNVVILNVMVPSRHLTSKLILQLSYYVL